MMGVNNQFLFSEAYLKDLIKEERKRDKETNQVTNNFSSLKDWHEPFYNGDYGPSQWKTDFIYICLDTLGFKKIIENDVVSLYTNAIVRDEKPIAICYVLDMNTSLDHQEKGYYYAYKAVESARKAESDWAILTNGHKWRIYSTKGISPYEHFLEMDIKDSLEKSNEPDDAFYLFNLFVNVKSYYQMDGGELYIETIKDKSEKRAEEIEEFLRGKAEEILHDLCYGLKEQVNLKNYTEDDRKKLFTDAITLLYRLLFFGYAESRGLLPCNPGDTEYKHNSFFKLCEEAKDKLNSGQAIAIKDEFDFWERMDNNLRIYVSNTYNGGLFHNDDKPILKEHRIANGYLIKCLAEIAYIGMATLF